MKYQQNTKVKYRLNGDESNQGTGKIVGLVNNGHAVMGRTYIIEPDQHLESEHYPYSHFVLPEIWFEAIG